jgi:hypothetical protein
MAPYSSIGLNPALRQASSKRVMRPGSSHRKADCDLVTTNNFKQENAIL